MNSKLPNSNYINKLTPGSTATKTQYYQLNNEKHSGLALIVFTLQTSVCCCVLAPTLIYTVRSNSHMDVDGN